MHDSARCDVLIWYAAHYRYAANSIPATQLEGTASPRPLDILSLHIQCKSPGLTLRSTRTPPALPFVLSQHFANSAPFVASVQA